MGLFKTLFYEEISDDTFDKYFIYNGQQMFNIKDKTQTIPIFTLTSHIDGLIEGSTYTPKTLFRKVGIRVPKKYILSKNPYTIFNK